MQALMLPTLRMWVLSSPLFLGQNAILLCPGRVCTNGITVQEADASEWRAPCEICGRRYYHEHVRSVTRGNQYSGDEPD